MPPQHVLVPVPMNLPAKRGVFAQKDVDYPIAIRMTLNDRNIVIDEAKRLGMSMGAFIRWCSIQMARELAYNRSGERPRADL